MSLDRVNTSQRTSSSEPVGVSSGKSNIKVVARFRPLIDFELDIENSFDHINFISDSSLGIGPTKDLEIFTLDRVFSWDSRQEEVYEFVGKSTIDDVLAGYNGTIFSYGQTGSGKTYTMMGGDLIEEDLRGIIPRATSQIFEVVGSDEAETEYTLKCSMLEIYKENLRDLLETSPKSLKIKECPRKGIYVQGLTQVCVTSERDMLEVISLGEQMRTVGSTKLNKTSSRSHLLFILEATQKLSNESEKKGNLNLVDLAGSEKVNHSGVTGNKLEEAKKINLSLSALGNVIHALTTNYEHVPYRDSKLTRLLQESLGGNYKTTLIVACSPSVNNQEETINTLKFALRAKTITNVVKMNIKNSPDNYLKMIERLKSELNSARQEIRSLKSEKDSPLMNPSSPASYSSRLTALRSRYRNSQTAKCLKQYSGDSRFILNTDEFRDSVQSERQDRRSSHIYEPDSLASSFYMNDKGFSGELDLDTIIKGKEEEYKSEIEKYKKKYHRTIKENKKLTEKVTQLEAKLQSSKNKQLQAEKKAFESYEAYQKSMLIINKDSAENSKLKKQNEKLLSQVNKLNQLYDDLNTSYKQLLSDLEARKDSTCVEFNDKSESYIGEGDVRIVTDQDEAEQDSLNLSMSKQFIGFDSESILDPKSPYANELKKVLADNTSLSKEFTIFQLKNLIIQAGIVNSNMSRALHASEWKLSIVKHKYEMKRVLALHQAEKIKALESMVDYLHDSYTHIVKLSETTEVREPKLELQPKTPAKLIKTLKPGVRRNARSNTVKGIEVRSSGSLNSINNTKYSGEDDSHEPSNEPSNFVRKVKSLETSLHLQQIYNQQLKKMAEESKSQTEEFKNMTKDLEKQVYTSQKEERERWRGFISELKENCEKELLRKQEEINRLNEVLGEWVNKFMEVQEKHKSRKNPDYEEIKSLLESTFVSRENFQNSGKNYLHSPLTSSIGFSPSTPSRRGLSSGDSPLSNKLDFDV